MAEEKENTGYDYGTDESVESGGEFKHPEVGDHSARLRSIIHCGLFRETFKGKVKKPAPQVVAIFELKDEEDFEDDGTTPLTINKAFPLKKGDKAFMTKFIKALDPKSKTSGFDELIGAPCTVNVKGSKELNDDDTPKYVNFGGMSGIPAKFAAMVDELVEGLGNGHVRFDDITEDAIMELNPALEVANILMKGEKYEGSTAETIIKGIRKDNPDFAKFDKKDEKADKKKSGAKDEVKTDLEDKEEF
jgi:hypothetical protein